MPSIDLAHAGLKNSIYYALAYNVDFHKTLASLKSLAFPQPSEY